ncbi:vigilin [Nephila pilipes]|uniref:Vigilin n=1 Tax=Nephila pilipes TaxID=299642 RepID=A0A8X6TR08_NEPPI|nr:vigilin [Nephila pilipes]
MTRKGRANIQKIKGETNTKIDLPGEGAESDVIVIRGPKEDVRKAKKRLLEISNEKKIVGQTAEIKTNPKQHKFLIRENGATSIKKACNEIVMAVLKKSEDFLESAKQRLHETVEDLEALVTVGCNIPQEHHRTVLGTRGSKVQDIQRQFNTTIKFPDREKNGNAD